MSYEVSRTIRFGDVDKAGIAYYPRIFDFCHQSFEEWWEGYMGRPYHDVIQKDFLGLPCVHIEADFKRPMDYGATVRARVSVVKLGDTSVVFRYQYMDADRQNVLASIDVTTVAVDMRTFKPRSIPDEFRKKMEACRPD